MFKFFMCVVLLFVIVSIYYSRQKRFNEYKRKIVGLNRVNKEKYKYR